MLWSLRLAAGSPEGCAGENCFHVHPEQWELSNMPFSQFARSSESLWGVGSEVECYLVQRKKLKMGASCTMRLYKENWELPGVQ